MKVVALKKFGAVENFYLDEWPLPQPGARDVRVRIRAVSFNPSDYKTRLGYVGGSLPAVLGKDFAGIVDAKGREVAHLQTGDAVFGYLGGPASNGTYADYVCVPEDFVSKKPRHLSFETAAALPLAGLTAYESVVIKGNLSRGQAVFIAGGSGGVGSMAIGLCRYLHAQPILTTAGSAESATYIQQELGLPPNWVIRYEGLSRDQLAAEILKRTGGARVSRAFDFVGGLMKALCCDVVDFDGHVVTIVPEPDEFPLRMWHRRLSPMFTRSASMSFEFLGARALFGGPETWHAYRKELEALSALIENSMLRPPITHDAGSFSVETVQKAHRLLEAGHVQGKIVMSMQ
jgi:NADPH:quinone reductase-like Zn-dependent oxidoreductase